jgi:hypothetical protein
LWFLLFLIINAFFISIKPEYSILKVTISGIISTMAIFIFLQKGLINLVFCWNYLCLKRIYQNHFDKITTIKTSRVSKKTRLMKAYRQTKYEFEKIY